MCIRWNIGRFFVCIENRMLCVRMKVIVMVEEELLLFLKRKLVCRCRLLFLVLK